MLNIPPLCALLFSGVDKMAMLNTQSPACPFPCREWNWLFVVKNKREKKGKSP